MVLGFANSNSLLVFCLHNKAEYFKYLSKWRNNGMYCKNGLRHDINNRKQGLKKITQNLHSSRPLHSENFLLPICTALRDWFTSQGWANNEILIENAILKNLITIIVGCVLITTSTDKSIRISVLLSSYWPIK